MNADGSGQTQVTTTPPFPETPAWSANGTRLAYAAIGDIYAVDSHAAGRA
jgi:Tol biopolymer transport system component